MVMLYDRAWSGMVGRPCPEGLRLEERLRLIA